MVSLGTPTTDKTPFVQAIFLGLNSIPGKHVYAGTVPEAEIAKAQERWAQTIEAEAVTVVNPSPMPMYKKAEQANPDFGSLIDEGTIG